MSQKRLGFLTTLYITAMGLSTAVASSVAVPITQATSWQSLVWVLTVVCALALVIWVPNTRHNHYLKKSSSSNENKTSWYKNGKVWAIMLFCGLQSLFVLYHDDLASYHGDPSRHQSSQCRNFSICIHPDESSLLYDHSKSHHQPF